MKISTLLAAGAASLLVSYVSACGGRIADVASDGGVDDDSGAIVKHDGGIDPPPPPPPRFDASPPRFDASPPPPPRDAGPDVDHGEASTTYPAFAPDMPQAVSSGGPVMTAPRFVPISFAGDPFVAQIDDFTARIGATSYWTSISAEYGVGAGSSATPIHLAETPAATLTDVEIQQWLAAKLDGTHPEFPAPTVNTLYAIYYPAGVTIDGGGGFFSCQDFGGYHSELALQNMTTVSYAVMPRCAQFATLSGFDVISLTSSHEFLEAATDPLPFSNAAYQNTDDAHFAWSYAFGSELGDLCVQNPLLTVRPAAFGYVVQRQWSNVSGGQRHDPCVPIPSGNVYFAAAAITPDLIPVSYQGQNYTGRGVHIPIGSTRTVELDLFSDADTHGSFTVTPHDLTGSSLSFTMTKSTGVNGEKLYVDIRVRASGPDGFNVAVFESRLPNGRVTSWPLLIGN